MSTRAAKIDAGAGVSFIASAVIHLAVFLLLVWGGRLFPPQMVIQETYYVDVVNLPTANPRSGNSSEKPGQAGIAPPVAAPPPMVAPPLTRAAPKTVAKPANPSPLESAETESAFTERLARLEMSSEARYEETVIDKLRNKMKADGPKPGTPGAGGAEAGSRYADYIKSRLEDALKVTSSYTTKNPEVSVRLTITADGRLSRVKVERSSGDAAFELAVRRAIDLASEKFTAPPNRIAFENGFVFKPKGISNGTSR